jgi:hypothetical protein
MMIRFVVRVSRFHDIVVRADSTQAEVKDTLQRIKDHKDVTTVMIGLRVQTLLFWLLRSIPVLTSRPVSFHLSSAFS